MLRRFPSIQHPTEYGYSYDSDAYDYKAEVDQHFRMYQTYNDGLTQHSGDWAITREYMGDYLAGLATAMLSDNELLENARWRFHCPSNVSAVAFCASVVFKPRPGDEDVSLSYRREAKPRYYSIEECKITTSASKQYDKRYHLVEATHDGSVGAIYRMLVPEYANALDRYALAELIRDWCFNGDQSDKRPYFYGSSAEFLWEKDPAMTGKKAQDLWHAFNACTSLFRSYELRSQAETALNNIRLNNQPVEAVVSAEDK